MKLETFHMIPKFYRLMTYESKQLRNRILKPKYLEYKNILIISIFLYYKIFRLFRQRSIIADAPAELSLVLLNYRFCCRRTRLRNWTGTELPLILVLNPTHMSYCSHIYMWLIKCLYYLCHYYCP